MVRKDVIEIAKKLYQNGAKIIECDSFSSLLEHQHDPHPNRSPQHGLRDVRGPRDRGRPQDPLARRGEAHQGLPPQERGDDRERGAAL